MTRNRFGTEPSCFLAVSSRGRAAAGAASMVGKVVRRDMVTLLSARLTEPFACWPRRGAAKLASREPGPTGRPAHLASTAPVLDPEPLLRLVIRVPFLGRLVVPAPRARGRASRGDLALARVGLFLLEPLEHRDPVFETRQPLGQLVYLLAQRDHFALSGRDRSRRRGLRLHRRHP